MLHRRTALSLIGGTALAAAAPLSRPVHAASGPLPRATRPEEVGLDSARLARIPAWLKGEVDAGRIPGAIVAVGRKGRLAFLESVGFRDREATAPMGPDAVFRIASMTKPIVSLALMMLAEEGKVHLQNPVSRYLPDFATQKVGVARQVAGRTEMAMEPVQRPTTVQDLLRHTSGLTYGENATDPVSLAYQEAKLRDTSIDGAEFTRRLAGLPLLSQPGSTWEYSFSTDVVGRIVEAVSGQDLHSFVTERICRPIGMADSGFFVDQAVAPRLAEPQNDATTGRRPNMRNPLTRPNWFSGGGGMVSTAQDYARFAQLLLDMGRTDDVRLVSRSTIALMRSNHLPPGTRYGAATPARFGALAPTPAMGQGFGLGFCVRTEAGRNPLPGSVGDHYWGGAQGTFFWVDPVEEMYAVLMMQAPAQRLPTRYTMRHLVYQALV